MKPISSIITREHIAGLWRLFVASGGVAILEKGLAQHSHTLAGMGGALGIAGAVMSWMFHTDNQAIKPIMGVTVTNGGAGYPAVPTATTHFIPGFTILPPGSPAPTLPPEANNPALSSYEQAGAAAAKKLGAAAIEMAEAVAKDKAAQPSIPFESIVKQEVEEHLSKVDWGAVLARTLTDARPYREFLADPGLASIPRQPTEHPASGGQLPPAIPLGNITNLSPTTNISAPPSIPNLNP